MTDMRIHSVQELYDKGFREFRVVHSGEAEALQEEIAALETSLAERWENLNVQDGVIDGLREEIAALRAENEKWRLGMQENCALRQRVAALEKVAGAALKLYEMSDSMIFWEDVGDALREAGYLKEEG